MTETVADARPRAVQRVAEELVASSGFLLARLGLAFKTKALARIEQEGFEANHYSVLAMLAEGARETQATIADALDLDPSRLVALLDSLEDRGFVARQRDPRDRRRHVVSITPLGTKRLQKLRSIAKQLEDEFLTPLTPDERASFHAMLLQLASEHDPRCGFAPTVSSAPD